jgi:Cryptococcal mannosyltransferase 1
MENMQVVRKCFHALPFRSPCSIKYYLFFVLLLSCYNLIRLSTRSIVTIMCEIEVEWMDRVKPKDTSDYEELELLDPLPQLQLQEGKNEMRKHKVILCGLARDNANELPNVIQYAERTGDLFQDYRIIIFENDSIDGTKEILQEWSVMNHKITILNQEYNNTKRPIGYGKEIEFLAVARNMYLQEISSHPDVYTNDFDLLMILDMDMKYGWDMRGIYHTFSHINEWEGVCSNGIYTASGAMYDMFAFRNEKFTQNLTHPLYKHFITPMGQRFYNPIKYGLLPVRSCFGGMAFYKRHYVNQCQYQSIYGDCEHVLFHDCITQTNGGRMFMNTAQVIRYKQYTKPKLGFVYECS